MATIITVTKNQHAQYMALNALVSELPYRTYPSGTAGYEDFHGCKDFLEALTTKQESGNAHTEAALELDPSRMTKRHLLTLQQANTLAVKHKFKKFQILDMVFNDEISEEELQIAAQISQASYEAVHKKPFPEGGSHDVSFLTSLRVAIDKFKKGLYTPDPLNYPWVVATNKILERYFKESL